MQLFPGVGKYSNYCFSPAPLLVFGPFPCQYMKFFFSHTFIVYCGSLNMHITHVLVLTNVVKDFLKIFIYLFLALLDLCCCAGFSLVVLSRSFSSMWCAGLSSQWLLLLRSIGCQVPAVTARGLSSCDSWALEHRLSSCGSEV